jgi:outer membrane protein
LKENIMKKNQLIVTSSLMFISAFSVGSALAQQSTRSSPYSLSVGFTALRPADSSGNLSAPALPNTQVDVGNATALTGAFNYRLNDQLSLSIPLGYGFKHKITGAGNPLIAGLGKLADVKVLPVTALGQFRIGNFGGLTPFVGGGITYAKFFNEKTTAALTAATNPGGPATTQKTDSKFAPTIQLGATFDVTKQIYVEGSYAKTFLKTKTTLSTNQTIDLTLNPAALTLQLGYRF